MFNYLQNVPTKSEKAIAAMTIASIAIIAMNTSIDSRLIVSIIILHLFRIAKIFRAEWTYNQFFTETEKSASQPTESSIETTSRHSFQSRSTTRCFRQIDTHTVKRITNIISSVPRTHEKSMSHTAVLQSPSHVSVSYPVCSAYRDARFCRRGFGRT